MKRSSRKETRKERGKKGRRGGERDLLLKALVFLASGGVGDPEGDVHPRPGLLLHGIAVETLGTIDGPVDPIGLPQHIKSKYSKKVRQNQRGKNLLDFL